MYNVIAAIILGAAIVFAAHLKSMAYYDAVTYECYSETYEERESPTGVGQSI